MPWEIAYDIGDFPSSHPLPAYSFNVAVISLFYSCFHVVRDMGILHQPHVTGGGAASANHPAFRAVNTALGNIKTSLSGTYHAFGFRKYARLYLGQVQYLFKRCFDLSAILERLARAASQAAPFPLRAVRAAETSC